MKNKKTLHTENQVSNSPCLRVYPPACGGVFLQTLKSNAKKVFLMGGCIPQEVSLLGVFAWVFLRISVDFPLLKCFCGFPLGE